MIFLTFETQDATLPHIKQIAQRILDSNLARPYLTDVQVEQLKTIARPTLNADQNESEIRKLCDELVETLVVYNHKGEPMRFHRDEAKGVMYFGDEQGWKMAQQFHNAKPLSV